MIAADRFLIIGKVGVQMGAPYIIIGLINESNSVVRALKESLDLLTVRFNPNRDLIDLVLRLSIAGLKFPDSKRS